MNAQAKVYRTRDAVVDLDRVLHVGGFNLDHALDVDPKFMEPEYPFEWASVYELAAGEYQFALGKGPDASMKATFLPLTTPSMNELEAGLLAAVLCFSGMWRSRSPSTSS